MHDNETETEIAKIMARAPSVEEHLAPYRQRIADLETKQLQLSGLTNRKRQNIHKELIRLRLYVSQFTNSSEYKKICAPSDSKKQKAVQKRLLRLARKADSQQLSTS